MNVEELQSVRDRERRTDKLQELRESFYADAGEFILALRERRDRTADASDEPYDDPEVKRLTDEIDTVRQTVEAIYEKRVGKIVKAASFAAADLPVDSDGMTAEEQALFDTLVGDITANRQRVLDVLDGEAPTGEDGTDPSTSGSESRDPTDDGDPAEATGTGRTDTSGVDAAAAMGGSATDGGGGPGDAVERAGEGDTPGSRGVGREPADTASDSGSRSAVDRETVRITDDVGPIFGVDEREYDLSEDDVVQLPADNVGPLVDRDAAERLE